MRKLTIPRIADKIQRMLAEAAPDYSPEEQPKLADAIARRLATQALALDGVPATERKRRIDNDLLSDVAYAVPDDAFDLLPSIVRAVVKAFTKGPVDALADLVDLLVLYRSLRVEISPDEAAVLRVLDDAKT